VFISERYPVANFCFLLILLAASYVSAKEIEDMKAQIFSGLDKEDLEDPSTEEGFEQALGNLANLRGFFHFFLLRPSSDSPDRTNELI